MPPVVADALVGIENPLIAHWAGAVAVLADEAHSAPVLEIQLHALRAEKLLALRRKGGYSLYLCIWDLKVITQGRDGPAGFG